MERNIRYVWWGVLGILLLFASWKLFLPHKAEFAVAEPEASSAREIVVYVTGAVESPGLVELPLNARLNDALKEVKLLPEANLDLINPAEKLKDGQKVLVPSLPQLQVQPQGSQVPSTPGAVPAASNQIPNNVAVTSTYPATSANSSGLININTADAAELDKLPGVGPAIAERILQYRNEHGAFMSPEDIQKVSGIGPKTYEKMASMMTVGP